MPLPNDMEGFCSEPMRIDVHTHGMHAERDEDGNFKPPLMPIWKPGDPEDGIRRSRELGIEKVVLVDPPEVAFDLARNLPDFCIPVPQVRMDESTPEEIEDLLSRGGRGIKFIAPMHSYGDNRYFPLYEVIRDYGRVAFFHTGFLSHRLFDPGGILGRDDYVDITHMRPAALDRIARAFPDLKMLLSHFGNPWWEEAWKILASVENVYADLSGGTAFRRSMNMWRELFAPNGELHTPSVSKLCFATDGCPFTLDNGAFPEIAAFHDRLYDELKLSDELRQKIDHGNAEMLFGD